MKKALRSTKIFAGVQGIGWTVVIVFMAWLFSGCSGGGSSDYVPPPCVNEYVPCLLDDWDDSIIFIDQWGYEAYLRSDGEHWTYECHAVIWPDGKIYQAMFVGLVDTCTTGQCQQVFVETHPIPYSIGGNLTICDDMLTLEWWHFEPYDTGEDFILQGKNPNLFK